MRPGATFATHYRLGRPAGGGASAVWLAWDARTDEPLALKFLPAALLQQRARREALRESIGRAQALEHVCIVRPRELIETPEQTAVVSPWIEGKNLAELRLAQRSRCFEVGELRDLVFAWADAMESAHAERVFHGALKPANLFVDTAGSLKIGDFGVGAWLASARAQAPNQRPNVAAMPYASPRLLKGETPTAPDDIYAFGAIIYELLTAQLPSAPARRFARKKAAANVPPLMSDRRKEQRLSGAMIPVAWEQMIAACLAEDAFARPRSFRAILQMVGMPAPEPKTVAANSSATLEPVEEPVAVSAAAAASGASPALESATARTAEPPANRAAVSRAGGAAATTVPPRPAPAPPPRVSQSLFDSARAHAAPAGRFASSWQPPGSDAEPSRRTWDVVVLRVLMTTVLLAILGTGGWYAWQLLESRRTVTSLEHEIAQLPLDASDDAIAAVESELAAADTRLNTGRLQMVRAAWQSRQEAIAEYRQRPQPGTIVVRTTPPGAQVRIGDRTAQPEPLRLEGLQPGSYVVHAQLDGYAPFEGATEITANQTAELNVRLRRLTGTVQLASAPQGAAFELVDVAGAQSPHRGETPAELTVPTGDYHVTFTREGHAAHEEQIHVDADASVTASAGFPEGRLAVATPDAEHATVAIDDIVRGSAPLDLSLPAGEHAVDVEFADGTHRSRRVRIENEQTLELAIEPPRAPAVVSTPAPPALAATETAAAETAPSVSSPANPAAAASSSPDAATTPDSTETVAANAAAASPGPAPDSAASTPEPGAEESLSETPVASPAPTADAPAAVSNEDASQAAGQPGSTEPPQTQAAPQPPANAAKDRDANSDMSAAAPPAVAETEIPASEAIAPADRNSELPAASPDAPAATTPGLNDADAAAGPPIGSRPIGARPIDSRPIGSPIAPRGSPAPTKAGEPVDYARVFALREVDVRPQLLERVDPKVGRRLGWSRKPERVELEIVIDRSGLVPFAVVRSATEESFVAPSLRAVRMWRFSPAKKDGHPVSVRVTVPLVFERDRR